MVRQFKISRLHTTAILLESSSSDSKEGLLHRLFTDKEMSRLLDVFNNETATELTQRAGGSKMFKQKIIKHRPYSSLEDVRDTTKCLIILYCYDLVLKLEKIICNFISFLDNEITSNRHCETSQHMSGYTR